MNNYIDIPIGYFKNNNIETIRNFLVLLSWNTNCGVNDVSRYVMNCCDNDPSKLYRLDPHATHVRIIYENNGFELEIRNNWPKDIGRRIREGTMPTYYGDDNEL